VQLPESNFLTVLNLIRLANRENGVTFSELNREGFSRQDIIKYIDLLREVKIPPFGSDDYFDFEIEGDTIKLYYDLRLALPVCISTLEAYSISLALDYLSGLSILDQTVCRSIVAKFRGFLQNQPIQIDDIPVHFCDDYPKKEWIQHCADAIQARRKLRISYFSQHQGVTGDRVVFPFRLYFREGMFYLRAYDPSAEEGNGGWRSFRIDRIRACQVQPEGFEPSQLPGIEGAQMLFLFEDGKLTHTETRFAAPSARYIRELLPDNLIDNQNDDSILLKYPVAGFPYFRSFVLQFGPDAVVLQPGDFRDAIIDHLDRLIVSLGEQGA